MSTTKYVRSACYYDINVEVIDCHLVDLDLRRQVFLFLKQLLEENVRVPGALEVIRASCIANLEVLLDIDGTEGE